MRRLWMWFIVPQIAGPGSSGTAARYAIRPRADADAFLNEPTLGPGYQKLVDAVWRQVVGRGVTLRELSGRPDDQKLVSWLTLFAGIAKGLDDDWTTTVTRAKELLHHAAEQGLRRCATTNGSSGPTLGPDTAPLAELDRESAGCSARLRTRPRRRRAGARRRRINGSSRRLHATSNGGGAR
jgi:uncharacterized protein (DUF1810 family)